MKGVKKMLKSNLSRSIYRGIPYFDDAKVVIFCKKLFAQELRESAFIDRTTVTKNYMFKDFHTLYIAEIDRVIVNRSDL